MSTHDEQQQFSAAEVDFSVMGSRWALIAASVGAVGLAAAVITALKVEHGAHRFFHAYLVSFMFVLSLALGGLFFVLVAHLTRAGWSVALRRIAEAVAWTVMPLALLASVILFGMHELYEWTHLEEVARDELLQGKSPWLNTTFFMIRLVFYFAVWIFLSTFFGSRSATQDRTGDPQITVQLEKVAAPGMIFYAMTVTFAAFDLLMSLYPHWYSTIYGVYFFAGAFLGFLAMTPLLINLLQRAGKLVRVVSIEHIHDMGKLIFAFVVFWAYIAFSQYFLIWYGNIPEETTWYLLRQTPPWHYLSILLLFGHFLLPFFLLMSRWPKRLRISLLFGAAWLLAMHWLDLFYLVIPNSRPEGPLFSILDFLCLIGLGGLFLGAVFWRLGRSSLIPAKDPRLDESLRFQNV